MIYVSHLLEDSKLQEIIGKTGCGVESIEFSIAENLDSLYRKIRGYEKRLKAMNCRELTLHGPFLDLNPAAYDRWIQEVTVKRFEEAYTAAQLLGAKKIIFHSGFIPRLYLLTGWAERVADFWNRFLEDKQGIQILMENVEDPEIWPLLEVAERVVHPDFGLCLDIGHAHCYSLHPVTEWAEKLGGHIKHIHLHDNDGTGDRHLALGEGNAPVEETLSCIFARNPEATCTIECSSAEAVLKSWEWLQEHETGFR